MKWLKRVALLLCTAAILSGRSGAQTPPQFLMPPPDAGAVRTPAAPIMSTHACNVRYYPSKLVNICRLGPVTIDFKVTAEGDVKDTTIANTSGDDEYDSLWASCVSYWRYTPATVNGQPVEVPGRIVVKPVVAVCGRQ